MAERTPMRPGEPVPGTAKAESADQRRQRLAAELRSNLTKRKAQARARAAQDHAQSEAGDE